MDFFLNNKTKKNCCCFKAVKNKGNEDEKIGT